MRERLKSLVTFLLVAGRVALYKHRESSHCARGAQHNHKDITVAEHRPSFLPSHPRLFSRLSPPSRRRLFSRLSSVSLSRVVVRVLVRATKNTRSSLQAVLERASERLADPKTLALFGYY